MLRNLLAVLLALVLPTFSFAEDGGKPDLETPQGRSRFLDGLTTRFGAVPLSPAGVTLNLGDRYYFLGPADSEKVLVEAWGNPKDQGDGVLGMVFPAGTTPLDPAWGAVVTYADTGYVPDSDARKTNYDDVLKRLRDGEDQDNEARKKAGLEQVHLVGWAQAPLYDQARHSLIWARQLHFSDQKDDTLNYDVRVLGRRGVLSLNMVSRMTQLGQIHAAANDLQRTAVFDQGSAYADFKPDTDKRAAYGVGGLILAGAGLAVAQKAGLLAVALLFLKKGFVVIAAAAAGGWAWIRRRLGNRKTAA